MYEFAVKIIFSHECWQDQMKNAMYSRINYKVLYIVYAKIYTLHTHCYVFIIKIVIYSNI